MPASANRVVATTITTNVSYIATFNTSVAAACSVLRKKDLFNYYKYSVSVAVTTTLLLLLLLLFK